MKKTTALPVMAILLLTSLVASKTAFAAPALTVGEALSSSVNAKKVVVRVAAGFHFNDKAPNVVTADGDRVKPAVLEKTKLEFELKKKIDSFKSVEASVYVCDDAQTFCEPRTINLKDQSEKKPASDKSSLQKSEPLQTKATAKELKKNEYDFQEDGFSQALVTAKKEKKLLLADFAARWCPGCVRLETEVFSEAKFQEATKNDLKVRIDVDRFENAVLKEKYAVRAIPTFMALTPDGNEIARLVDFQSLETISSFLKSVRENPLSMDDLKLRVDKGDLSVAETLGRRMYFAGRYQESLPVFEKVKPIPVEYLDAKVQAIREAAQTDEAAKDKLVPTLKEVLAQEAGSSRSLVWRQMWIEQLPEDSDEREKIAAEGLIVADGLLSAEDEKIKSAMKGDLVGEFEGYEKLLIASHKADLIEAANLGEEKTKKAWQEVAQRGTDLKIPLERKGPSLRLLIFLTAAEDYINAEKLGRGLLKLEPGNPEIQRRLVKVLNAQKKFKEAIQMGRQALPESYGQNEIWVAGQLAKAYIGAGKNKQAARLLENYLKRDELEWPSMKKDQEEFQRLLASVSGSKN